jgi:uncharacterized protein YukE
MTGRGIFEKLIIGVVGLRDADKSFADGRVILFAGFLLLAGISGCRDRVTKEDVTRKTKEAVDVTKRYVEQQKEVYVEKLDAQMAPIRESLESLKQDAVREYRQDMQSVLGELDAKQEALVETINRFRSESAERFRATEGELQHSIEELREAVDRARSQLQSAERQPVMTEQEIAPDPAK